MPDLPPDPADPQAEAVAEAEAEAEAVPRKRPKPGERRLQILQTLAAMLEQAGAERVTTASLAARIGVSEAALYRHFASKAQMFEGLIDFIEQSVFTLVNQVLERQPNAAGAARIAGLVAQFAERNPGMARVMVGDALVYEHERLQQRMNQFFDRVESALRQALRAAATEAGAAAPTAEANLRAAAVTALLVGRLQRFVRSGFRQLPTERLGDTIALLL